MSTVVPLAVSMNISISVRCFMVLLRVHLAQRQTLRKMFISAIIDMLRWMWLRWNFDLDTGAFLKIFWCILQPNTFDWMAFWYQRCKWIFLKFQKGSGGRNSGGNQIGPRVERLRLPPARSGWWSLSHSLLSLRQSIRSFLWLLSLAPSWSSFFNAILLLYVKVWLHRLGIHNESGVNFMLDKLVASSGELNLWVNYFICFSMILSLWSSSIIILSWLSTFAF